MKGFENPAMVKGADKPAVEPTAKPVEAPKGPALTQK
tara:strand:+ start:299 stop:409 length:111 start_codon:yes stop_codon:yes gene_type:complete